MSQFIDHLEMGLPQTLLVYGTSLSYHLTPPLRSALVNRYGDLANVINSGLSAKASRTGLEELEAKVLRFAPDVLLLEFAVNDAYDYLDFPEDTLDRDITLKESRANLEQMLDTVLATLPRCEIILQTMNPTYDSKLNDARAGARRPDLASFYQGYREVALARGLKLIDNTAMWQMLRLENEAHFEALIPDGAHPTPAALREFVVPFLLDQLSH